MAVALAGCSQRPKARRSRLARRCADIWRQTAKKLGRRLAVPDHVGPVPFHDQRLVARQFGAGIGKGGSQLRIVVGNLAAFADQPDGGDHGRGHGADDQGKIHDLKGIGKVRLPRPTWARHRHSPIAQRRIVSERLSPEGTDRSRRVAIRRGHLLSCSPYVLVRTPAERDNSVSGMSCSSLPHRRQDRPVSAPADCRKTNESLCLYNNLFPNHGEDVGAKKKSRPMSRARLLYIVGMKLKISICSVPA